jgi:hypothetical protein
MKSRTIVSFLTMMLKWSILFFVEVATIISCASGPHQLYSGPTLPKEKMSTLQCKVGSWDAIAISILEVDGKKLDIWPNVVCGTLGGFVLNLLPGEHSVKGRIGYTGDFTIRFIAEAGYDYLLKPMEEKGVRTVYVSINIEDMRTGDIVGKAIFRHPP